MLEKGCREIQTTFIGRSVPIFPATKGDSTRHHIPLGWVAGDDGEQTWAAREGAETALQVLIPKPETQGGQQSIAY